MRKETEGKKKEKASEGDALFRNEEGELMSVEESFKKIEERIALLENGETTLEESFRLFKEGMELIRYTDTSISSVEEQVRVICEDGSMEDFE